MSRRQFQAACWIAMSLLACKFYLLPLVHAEAREPDHPNVLWIVAENFALDFGCYGAANVQTSINSPQVALDSIVPMRLARFVHPVAQRL